MTDPVTSVLVQAGVGLVSAVVGAFSSYKLLEYRIDKLEVGLDNNEEEHKQFRTMEQHTECKNHTCGKIAEVKGIVTNHEATLNKVKACINRHVDGCTEIECNVKNSL